MRALLRSLHDDPSWWVKQVKKACEPTRRISGYGEIEVGPVCRPSPWRLSRGDTAVRTVVRLSDYASI